MTVGVRITDWSGRYVAPESHRPHGTRTKYVVEKCRCQACTEASRDEMRAYAARSKTDVAYVDAAPVRAHVRELMAAGVGLKQIVKVSGVPQGTLWKLVYGDRKRFGRPSKRITRATRDRLLAVTPRAIADGARVDATPTWRLLDEMIAAGITRTSLAQALGQQGPGLQVSRKQVLASRARQVADLHARWRAGQAPELKTAGTRWTPPPPAAAPPQRELSLAERRARYNDLQALFEQLAEVVEIRNARTWRNDAACRGRDPDMWFPARGHQTSPQTRLALSICAACIVRDQCAAEAESDKVEGIWAGSFGRDRRGRGAA